MRLIGARQAIHDATALHLGSGGGEEQAKYGCRIQHSVTSRSDDMIVDALEAGRILRAVDAQLQPVRWWLMYAYAAEVDVNQRAFLSDHLFRGIFPLESRRTPKLRRLCDVAVDDYKMRQNNGRHHSQAYICHEIGVADANYRRDGWGDDLSSIHRQIDALDRAGLGAVAEVIQRLRGDVDECA